MLETVKSHIPQKLRGKSATSFGEHPMFRPERDWVFLLSSSVILALVAAGIGAYFFLGVKEGAFFAQESKSETQTFTRMKKNELTNVIEYYEQKRSRFSTFKTDAPDTFDPSR